MEGAPPPPRLNVFLLSLVYTQNLSVEEACRLSRENAKDIIACGFDPKRTFIFSDFAYMGGDFYKNCARIAKARDSSRG